MKDILFNGKIPTIDPNDSYLLSYPHLVAHFANKNIFSESDFVCGAHMVYGWMPRILTLHPHASTQSPNFSEAAEILTTAKQERILTEEQLKILKQSVNNSLTGASKLLHFVAPEAFAIWDSHVHRFVSQGGPRNPNSPKTYLYYMDTINKLSLDGRFEGFYSRVKGDIKYDVSPFRALEFVMFLRGRDMRAPRQTSRGASRGSRRGVVAQFGQNAGG